MRLKRLRQSLPDINLGNLLIGFAILFGVFIFANALIYLLYHGKAYPNSTIAGKNVSGNNFREISLGIKTKSYIPAVITVKGITGSQTVNSDDFVDSINSQSTITQLKNRYLFLPVLNLFIDHNSALVIKYNHDAVSIKSSSLSKMLSAQPVNAEIVIKKGLFVLNPQNNGYEIKATEVKADLEYAAENGQSKIILKAKESLPEVTNNELQASFSTLKAQQNTSVSYTLSGAKVLVPPQDISTWYVKKGQSYELSNDLVRAYLIQKGATAGYSVNNISDVVAKITSALRANNQLAVDLKVSKIVKTYTYCITFKGVNSNNFATLSQKLVSVYSDPRGWSLNGQVVFKYVKNSCQFTVWLTASKLMPTFGAICDKLWSCNVGSNVVLNYDRWQNASDAWNKAGGSLDDYRSMVINHETGHFLGFVHNHCGGPGQLAPVMQQQSIDLEGCKFNPWPLPSELAMFKARIF